MSSQFCESKHLGAMLTSPIQEWFSSNGRRSPVRIASAIGVNISAVSRWLATENAPLSGQYDLSRLALQGMSVAEVARRLGVCLSNFSRRFSAGHVLLGRREDLLRVAVELACRNETSLTESKEVETL